MIDIRKEYKKMKRTFCFEISRVFRCRGFLAALVIGIAIAIGHWVQEVLPLTKSLSKQFYLEYPMLPPPDIWSYWIGGGNTGYSYFLFLILPILSVLPFADSFFTDVKGHFIIEICTRTNRKYYFLSKYLATFLAGGMVSICPFILNLILTATVLPGMKTEAAAYTTLFVPKSSMENLFFEHPLLYTAISLEMIFIFCGCLATIALFVGFYTNYRFLVLVSPFLVVLFFSSLSLLLGKESWQMSNFLHPGYNMPRILPFIVLTLLLFLVSVYEFIIRGRKDDIY